MKINMIKGDIMGIIESCTATDHSWMIIERGDTHELLTTLQFNTERHVNIHYIMTGGCCFY